MANDYKRVIAARPPELVTFQDLLDHLVGHRHGGTDDATHRDIKRAVLSAYDDIQLRFNWRYYEREHTIFVEGLYNTGTIEFDYTGGSSERLVTLTTGTWPSWAGNARIKIGDVVYDVYSRLGSSTLQLSEGSSPLEDVASGTSYTLFQDIYPLPPDFKEVRGIHSEDGNWSLAPISLDEWQGRERHIGGQGSPNFYALGPDPGFIGQMAIYIQDIPTSDQTLRMMYLAGGRPLKYSGQESDTTTGTVANSGTTVTGTTTAFTADMVGSVIRGGTTSSAPTGRAGLNPYVHQAIITAFTDATHVTIDNAPTTAWSGTKFRISDPIDIRPTMIEALLRGCEWKLAVYSKDSKEANQAEERYMRALILAKEADSVPLRSDMRGLYRPIGWSRTAPSLP